MFIIDEHGTQSGRRDEKDEPLRFWGEFRLTCLTRVLLLLLSDVRVFISFKVTHRVHKHKAGPGHRKTDPMWLLVPDHEWHQKWDPVHVPDSKQHDLRCERHRPHRHGVCHLQRGGSQGERADRHQWHLGGASGRHGWEDRWVRGPDFIFLSRNPPTCSWSHTNKPQWPIIYGHHATCVINLQLLQAFI